MTVANSASISADIAGRYAQALFDLVRDSGGIDTLSNQVDELAQAFESSDDLRDLTVSPLYDRQGQEAAIGAIAATGVTYVSVGRLTQSAPAADIGLDFTPL